MVNLVGVGFLTGGLCLIIIMVMVVCCWWYMNQFFYREKWDLEAQAPDPSSTSTHSKLSGELTA
jgi:hypothetical protein